MKLPSFVPSVGDTTPAQKPTTHQNLPLKTIKNVSIKSKKSLSIRQTNVNENNMVEQSNVLRKLFIRSLDVLEKFIIYATKELSVELGEDDYEGLLQVMRVMNEVKAKVDADTDHMFEPLRDIIDVLKEYGVDFPEETYEQVSTNKLLMNFILQLFTMPSLFILSA